MFPHQPNGGSSSTKTTHMLIYRDYETLSTWVITHPGHIPPKDYFPSAIRAHSYEEVYSP